MLHLLFKKYLFAIIALVFLLLAGGMTLWYFVSSSGKPALSYEDIIACGYDPTRFRSLPKAKQREAQETCDKQKEASEKFKGGGFKKYTPKYWKI